MANTPYCKGTRSAALRDIAQTKLNIGHIAGANDSEFTLRHGACNGPLTMGYKSYLLKNIDRLALFDNISLIDSKILRRYLPRIRRVCCQSLNCCQPHFLVSNAQVYLSPSSVADDGQVRTPLALGICIDSPKPASSHFM
jgi:hypothetical protein